MATIGYEEYQRLVQENIRLKKLLGDLEGKDSKEVSVLDTSPGITTHLSPPDEKVGLFLSLFRGRTDVYAVRWTSKTSGKSGYSPACAGGYYDRQQKEGRDYLPYDQRAVEAHLRGRSIIGIYPLLPDETTNLLVADFDGNNFREDARAYAHSLQSLDIPAAVEQSRSCNGAHVWVFFSEPIPAALARQLGFIGLTRAIEGRHEIKLCSYDRLFPNQDTMPKGGFGNLIALPLQRAVRDLGGSVFVDLEFTPYSDQWAYLSQMKRASCSQVISLIQKAEEEKRVFAVKMPATGDGEADPWLLPLSKKRMVSSLDGPLPDKLVIAESDLLYVPKEGVPSPLLSQIKALAAFQNPEFFKQQAMRLPVYGIPRIISCSEEFPKHIGLPRGCREDLESVLEEHGIVGEFDSNKSEGISLAVSFQGELSDIQRKAFRAMKRWEIGTLAATTAFGKTVLAIALIAERGVNVLILVHRQQLLEQWRERISTFLGVPKKDVGVIGGGLKRVTGRIDVAMVQSLVRKGEVQEIVAGYGHLIVDECHHIAAFSFEQVARRARARYVLGLTATPGRRDGHHPIIFMQCGPIRHRVSAKEQAAHRSFNHEVIFRDTNFEYEQPRAPIHELYELLSKSEPRNALILGDIWKGVGEGRNVLVLTERTNHLELLQKELEGAAVPIFVLRGGMRKGARETVIRSIAEADEKGGGRVILATGRFIGEGFDDPRLDTLHLALPISWAGTLQQYVGRLHREHHGKKDVRVYDYVDARIPMLKRMFERRRKGYIGLGYQV